MAQEMETKVLDIDAEVICNTLAHLGAKKVLDTRFTVDWFRPTGVREGKDPWFLRIRTNSEGQSEATWKARSELQGMIRKHKEINFMIADPVKLADLFQELGLESYAHQEKNRKSFTYRDWRFDVDQYPGMPPFLEIEGTSEAHIREAMDLLSIANNRTWNEGERTLIQDIYGLNWYDLRFTVNVA